MRLPCEKWLEALITVEPVYTNTEIQNAVSFRGYPVPTGTYLDMLRARQAATKPGPYDPRALHCIRWLKELRVYDYIRKYPAVEQAISLLGLNEVREKLEALILGRVSPADLSYIIQESCGIRFDDEVYGYYRHFFWNPECMSSLDWDAFFPAYATGDLLEGVYAANDQNAALAKAGLGLNLDVGDIVDMLAADSYARYKALGHSPTDEDTRKSAQVWANILLRASEIKVKSGDVSVKMLELLESFRLDTDPTERKSIQDLKRGGDLIALPGVVDGTKE